MSFFCLHIQRLYAIVALNCRCSVQCDEKGGILVHISV